MIVSVRPGIENMIILNSTRSIKTWLLYPYSCITCIRLLLLLNILCLMLSDNRYSCGVSSADSGCHNSPACSSSPSSASANRCPAAFRHQRFWKEDLHVPAVRLQHYPAGRAVAALRFRSPEDQKPPVRPMSLCSLAKGNA